MADTTTANIGLLIADLNDTFNFGAHVENNFTTIDGLMGLVKCTSGTRPSNTYGGQGIYETDTLRVAVNTGTKGSPVWTYVTSAILSGLSSARPSTGLFTGLAYYETDTTRLVIYNGSSWEQKAFSNFVCTSSAHPASPFTGLNIFETDTSLNAIYNGSGYLYGVKQVAATQTLNATTASITFSGLPAGVNAFLVRWSVRCSDANGAEPLRLQFNGVSTNSYIWEVNQANNASVAATTSAGAATFIQIGTVAAANATANYWSSGQCIVDNGNANRMPTAQGSGAAFATTTSMWCGVYSGMYAVATPVTSITLFGASGSFVAGSQFSIYALQ